MRLAFNLSSEAAAAAEQNNAQRTMSVLGLLHLIWELSGLCYWHGGAKARGWRWTGDVLRGSTDDILVAGHLTKSISLSRRLALLQPESETGRRNTLVAAVHDILEKAAKNHHCVVLLGELSGIRKFGEDGKLRFKGDGRFPLEIWMRDIGDLARRFDTALTALDLANADPKSPKCIFIGVAEIRRIRTKSGDQYRADMLDTALMPVTATFVPYASSYERRIADLLFDQQRVFRKPLRYDAAEDLVLPDFELLDTSQAMVPMEVFGMNTAEYRERMEEKISLYDARHGAANWWKWIVQNQKDPPDFPTAT